MRIKIASVGEPVLRNVARALRSKEIASDRIRELIEHMRETLADAPGVGLAAPQIGDPLQLAIVEDKTEYQTTLTAALPTATASQRRCSQHAHGQSVEPD